MFRLLLLFALLPCALPTLAQSVHDYDNLPEARSLSVAKTVTATFPKTIDGRPDWVRALERGLIAPRATKTGAPRPPEVLENYPKEGIVFSNTQFMPNVVFPHQPHVEWLTCMNCHDTLFDFRATGRGKGMVSILRGEHCGFCHGRVAFSPIGSCYRCHSKPNPNAIKDNSPFVEPTSVEQAEKLEPLEKPRRRGAGAPRGLPPAGPSGGRLVPSVVPPPVNGPVAPAEVPVLE